MWDWTSHTSRTHLDHVTRLIRLERVWALLSATEPAFTNPFQTELVFVLAEKHAESPGGMVRGTSRHPARKKNPLRNLFPVSPLFLLL